MNWFLVEPNPAYQGLSLSAAAPPSASASSYPANLDSSDVHVVFTLPHQLAPLVFHNKKILYSLLFRASSATLLEIAADPKHLGADIGFLSVLHTWGQNLLQNPHS